MDRQIPIANRVIDKKMQQFRTRKHRQTLSQIRNKSTNAFQTTLYHETPKNNRYSMGFIENKNLQIEKQNIKLFNKIASIIRQKPKILNINNSYSKVSQDVGLKHKKRLDRIKTQNQLLEKRISQQKSTINNKLLFKDRIKNVKYLKLIGRFPYQNDKRSGIKDGQNQKINTERSQTEPPLVSDVEVYRKKTSEFMVKITKISNNYYIFTIQIQNCEKVYHYTMNKQTYDYQLMKCGYNYDELISRLRLNEKHEVYFEHASK